MQRQRISPPERGLDQHGISLACQSHFLLVASLMTVLTVSRTPAGKRGYK